MVIHSGSFRVPVLYEKKQFLSGRRGMISNRLRTVLISVLCGLTVLNNVAPLFAKSFNPSTEINGAFVLLIGAVVATYTSSKNNSGGGGNNNGGGTP